MTTFGIIAVGAPLCLASFLMGMIAQGAFCARRINDLVNENEVLRATLIGAEQD